MGKLDAKMEGRYEGMVFALEIVKKGGVEALEEEVRKRGLSGFRILVPHKELEKWRSQITQRTIDMVMAIGCLTLHDVFGMGKVRLQRWLDRFFAKTRCLIDPKCGVDETDYLQVLKDETGLTLSISEGFIGR